MYKLSKSPKSDKKFRITLPNRKIVDFGAKGYSDYTIHKTPSRMRLYVQRHGGKIPNKLKEELKNSIIQKKMLNVTKSDKEDWSKNGLNTAGFWSRWLLWSYPSLSQAKRFIERTFRISIQH